MITRDQFLSAISRERDICNHVFSKLHPDSYDYRPGETMRSTRELLQYLSICGIGAVRGMIDGNFAAWESLEQQAEAMPMEEFPAAMNRQIEAIGEALATMTDDELLTRTGPVPGVGPEVPFGEGLVRAVLEWLVAYRMQLFLYAKMSGNPQLSTANCWAGRDPKPKPVEA
ncbi:MAG: DinB family protein [Armatimonadetes bacterium]|nr:DinB family protein [Armatimonadota bacterium]